MFLYNYCELHSLKLYYETTYSFLGYLIYKV